MSDTYQSKYTGVEIDKRLEWSEEISPHIAKQLNTETGIHGIRYWQDKLEYNDGESWVEIETGSGSVADGASEKAKKELFDNLRLRADIDYISIMTGVEI